MEFLVNHLADFEKYYDQYFSKIFKILPEYSFQKIYPEFKNAYSNLCVAERQFYLYEVIFKL